MKKKCGVVMLVFMTGSLSCMQGPYHAQELSNVRGELSVSRVPFLEQERNDQRLTFKAEVRDHSIDCVIASLFLVGSGIPGISDEIKLAANVSASVLWLGDSSIRLFYALKKWRMPSREPIAPLREVVVN